MVQCTICTVYVLYKYILRIHDLWVTFDPCMLVGNGPTYILLYVYTIEVLVIVCQQTCLSTIAHSQPEAPALSFGNMKDNWELFSPLMIFHLLSTALSHCALRSL